MIRLIADENIPYLRGVLEPYADIIYLPGERIDHSVVSKADGLLIRTRTRCDSNLLRSSAVKFIATATIGYDHIDTEYCLSNHIQWANAAGCNASSVQQYIASALLTISHQQGFCLQDKVLGIVGVGNVGSEVKKLAHTLGMKVLLNDPPRARKEGGDKFVTLEYLLQHSDIVSLHTPLILSGIDKTYHLIDDTALGFIKAGAWIINTARGEVADSNALKQALSSGKAGGAVLDVWENEPYLDEQLLSKVKIGTPHIGGYSADGRANGTAMIVQAVSAHFHFPLQDWYPSLVPPPRIPQIFLDGRSGNTEDLIRQAVLHTYNIMEDDTILRADTRSFELQRKNYPVRREFHAFSISKANIPGEAVDILFELGFSFQ